MIPTSSASTAPLRPLPLSRRLRTVLRLLLLVLPGGAAASAQQPFVSDDANVTPAGGWHFEYFNEYAALSRNAAPDLRQDTNNFAIQYGLLRGLELDVDFPLIAIARARRSTLGSAFGLGDVDFAAKYALLAEAPENPSPAVTLIAAVELPTGDKGSQLGSGYTDVVFNSVAQKTFSDTTVLHLNFGYQISGNTQTGAIGIRTKGRIVTAGVSVVREVTQTLRLGADVNGAQIRTAQAYDRQLQLTVGGSYAFRKNATFDFALLGGRFDSPRVGVLLGMSYSP